ncbi:hypothetical protein F4818DRAFT_441076 [Hypoxylon cercidicola]|nr:hypothetical protein F4818DRAFT_441076 [Hypoxylon cercidicola]
MATQQNFAATSITSLKPTYHNGTTNENQPSVRGQPRNSIQYGENSAVALRHKSWRIEELDNSRDHSDPVADSSNSTDYKRRGVRLDISIPELPLFSEADAKNAASSTIIPETPSSVEQTNLVDEREMTLRMLESGPRPSTHRSSSPATIRRHRRSYQLATDPRIDPQQYSDFLDFLQHEVSMDISLRVRIWKSLIEDSENKEGSAIQLESRHDTSSHGHPSTQYSSPLSPISPGPSNHRPDPGGKRRVSSWIWKQNDRKVRFEDGQLPLLERKLRKRQSCPDGYDSIDSALHMDRFGEGSSRRSKRHSHCDSFVPRETFAEKRRRLSASSLAHSFTQYIKPEVPSTTNREPRDTLGSPDLYEMASQMTAIPESRME